MQYDQLLLAQLDSSCSITFQFCWHSKERFPVTYQLFFAIDPILGKNYEEFRAFVACSDLKPVPRSHISDLFQASSSKIQQRAFTQKLKKKTMGFGTTEPLSPPSRQLIRKPRNALEFQRDWRRHCPTLEQKAQYLTAKIGSKFRIDPFRDITKIFKSDLDCDVMHEIFDTLKFIASNADDRPTASFIYQWMHTLTTCDRFYLHISFSSTAQKQTICFLCNFLHEKFCIRGENSETAKRTSFSEEQVSSLKTSYGVI